MKRLKSFLYTATVFAAAVVAATAVFSFAAQSKYGDINGDSEVDTKDLIRLMKYISADGEGVEAYGTDMNGDGNVNTIDLIRLMKYIANPSDYETESPDTEPEETVGHEDEAEISLDELDPAVGRITTDEGAASVQDWQSELNNAIVKTTALREADISASRSLISTDNSVAYERIGSLRLRITDGELTRGKLRERVSVNTVGQDTAIFYGAGKAYLPLLEDPSYMTGALAKKTFADMTKLYLAHNIDTSALSGAVAYKNSDGSVVITVNATSDMLSGSFLDVTALRAEALSHLSMLESPGSIGNIKLSCSINKDGYISYFDIEFSFGAVLRIDQSNTRQKTMVFKYAASLDHIGETITIGEPDDLDCFIPYDASSDIAAAIGALFKEDGSKVDGFDEKYGSICALYGKEDVEEIIIDLGLEDKFDL